MAKKYNLRRIKGKRPYSVSQIVKELGVHKRTVQGWGKKGLQFHDEMNPRSTMGYQLKRFLRQMIDKRRYTLKPREFRCLRCHCPRRSRPEALSVQTTNRHLGPHAKQLIIRGKCEVCGCRLWLFSSDRLVKQFQDEGWLPREHS